MLYIDHNFVPHIIYLLNYCGAHRDCSKCKISNNCNTLETSVLYRIKHLGDKDLPMEFGIDNDEAQIIVELIEICGHRKLCRNCSRVKECLILEVKIEKELDRPKELTEGAKK